MANSEQLSLRFGIDSDDAVKGVSKVTDALDKTAAATKKTSAGAGELTGNLKTLAQAGGAADAAFAKLSKAQTPVAMTRGIVQAEIALEAFRKAADAAAASGEKMPTGIAAALKKMQGDLDSSTTKLGQLRDRMGDVKTKADAMGQGWSQAATSGGSLRDMLDNLEASSGGATRSFTRVALGAIGVAAAFKTGYTAGKEFSAFMKTLGVDVDVSSKAWSNFAFNLSKVAGDTKVGAWLRDLGDSTRDYSALLTPLAGKMNEQMKAHQQLAREIDAHNKVLKDLGIDYHTAGEATETLDKKIAALATRFRDATKSGETLGGMAKANATALDEIQAAVDRGDKKWNDLDETMKKVLTAHRELPPVVNTLTGGLQSLTAANEAYKQSLLDVAAAESKMNAELAAGDAAIKKRNNSIVESSTITDKFQHGLLGMEGTLAVAMQGFMKATVATDAQTAALHRLLTEQGLYTQALQETMGVAKGWSDYLAVLNDSYQSGVTSLIAYKNALSDFLHQLETQFANATGKAKEALETMIATVRDLINTAGAGARPSGDMTAGGLLNRTFNKP